MSANTPSEVGQKYKVAPGLTWNEGWQIRGADKIVVLSFRDYDMAIDICAALNRATPAPSPTPGEAHKMTEAEIERVAKEQEAISERLGIFPIEDRVPYIVGFKSGLRYARDRFSAPPAIDVEKIMEVVRRWVAGQLGMTPENEHWKDEEWQAAVPALRSRLLSLLSTGNGEGKDEGVPVAENKAPRS